MSRVHALMALAIFSWTCSGEALGKDQRLGADSALKLSAAPSPLFALPAAAYEPRVFSATEFRPRKPALIGADSATRPPSIIDAPMPKDTSIGRQLAEFKTQDRVRLLTLWRSSASSLSLQAGKRGMPSLQWSTPWMHRDAVSRGLFDRFLTPRAGGGVRTSVPRQSATLASSQSAETRSSFNSK
ncbi:MAG TPA: hypothetical protein VGI90_05160 [Steroidobacteraceae bacterium]|jgi:hypothetical protein